MADALARLKAANADVERRDSSLRPELQEKRERARVIPEGMTSEAVEVGGRAVPYDQFAQETIVRRTGRPVLAINRNQARLVFEDPDSRVWKERLERASAALAQAAAAVGRVEVQGHPLAWLGTGWLVAPDIIVTNRHVAQEFGRRRGADIVFRQGISGAPMSASIDFLEELESQASLAFAVARILHIEDDDGPDVAFLRVQPGVGQTLARPIALAPSAANPDETVAVIGYPARDSRIPDVDLMDKIYGNKYDKKRLAPGQVMRAGREQLQHDCTTLGGNSGSAVISLSSGEAVGLHFAGTFLTANFAVPSTVIQQKLDLLSRPGTGTRPASPRRIDRETDTAGFTVQNVPPGSAASVSFNLPMRVTVDVGAPAGGGSVSGAAPATPPEDARNDREGEQAPAARSPETAAQPERVEWSAELFSLALTEALTRHDFKAADRLLGVFEEHWRTRPHAYPALYANRDLSALRKKRQFVLMRRYAEAAIAGGVENMQVHRQYGQALIELGEFDMARDILGEVLKRSDVNRGEAFEAQGLIGRSYKQEYVDDPTAPGAADRLRRAVEAYQSVYEQDSSQLWHGINVATCRSRAHRDGMEWADEAGAKQIAQALLEQIGAKEQAARKNQSALDVWDYPTRIEALVLLGNMAEAEANLDLYLSHPDADAFEVTSTYRQFTEVLQLGADTPIVSRLREAVERLRGGGALRDASPSSHNERPVSVLIRVSDPDWQPSDVPGLRIHSRTGTVISAEGPRDSLRELLKDTRVFSVEESRPGGTTDCVRSVPYIRVNVKAEYTGPDGVVYTERGDQALIAVIDDGIDILHSAFVGKDGRSRIVGIWDQRAAPAAPPPGFTYGKYYDAATVAAAVTAKSDLGIGRNPGGHGTHVASIAAGCSCGTFGGGVAPEASLLIVITDNKSSIGYSRPHADALSFIDAEATRLNLPVVVNVSQGMNAGAHDGKSPLEARFNTFCTSAPGRVVVKSAGNEGQNQGHAEFNVGQNMATVLKWRRAQAAQWPREHIELWWRYGNELEFRLGAPSGHWSNWVTLSQPTASGVSTGPGKAGYILQLVKSHPDHADSVLRIDISGQGEIESGEWQLEIVGRKVKQNATVHAWIERGDPEPSRFLNFVSDKYTLSIPGTAEYVITVGAVGPVDPQNPDRPIRLGDFSSHGPTRDNREKPDVVAPGVNIEAACGGTASEVTCRDGTSMAAPHVAGAIALALSKGKKAGVVPTAAQIAVALRQNTLNSSMQWNFSEGYGVIDVSALLAAFPG